EKGDPYANFWEVRPKSASIVWDLSYKWKDGRWMKGRRKKNSLDSPLSAYEVHLGSWRRPDPNNHEIFYSYKEITEKLVPYVQEMGFTHVELMPIMEHPYDGSWGYQGTGYYAPTSRYGTPQEFMEMVDAFHRAGIGVILDWVPSHFPYDAHGLFRFDGSHVYEYADMRQGFQPDWNSYIFNYKRNEVRAFLISNALFWLDKYHIDGLRVDAVASMIYVDYSRNEGGWVANEFGGRENLEAISFLRELNETVYGEYPDVQTIAEESTSFYGVSKPVFMGGLGFGMKWMMGWMNDTLDYFKRDPYYRQWHQNQFTFSIIYAFSENFMLPLSHDEVVHGKASLIYKMPGDEWQKFANLRLLYIYMFTHPGTKLLFMGGEFGQTAEWNYKSELQWSLLQYEPHKGLQKLVKDLNHLYSSEAALYETQFDAEGFEWIDITDYQQSVIVYCRKGNKGKSRLIIALNLTPVPRENYKIGIPASIEWKEILNSDAGEYWGSGIANSGVIAAKKEKFKDKTHSLTLHLPPLGGVVLKEL
ncbi:MAG TPA: 1,4-alpha-glucan branching protein GlgB, partial [Chitinophagaceae bacterium]